MATTSNGSPGAEQPVTRYAAIATAATVVAFLPSLAANFVYDDLMLISENPYAQSIRYLFRGFGTHLWDVFAYGSNGFGLHYYRPVVSASYVLNWVASGGAPWTFHLFNVLCHGAATFFVVRLVSRWTNSVRLGLLAGLIFGIHPTRTESVIWVSGRTDVLMALFMFAAVDLAWSAAHRERRRAAVMLGAAVGCLGLGLLSKEAAATTALLVGVDYLVERDAAARKRLATYAAVFAVVGVVYVAVRSAVYPVGSVGGEELTPRYGLFTIWAYFERIAFPWPQTFFYRPVVEEGGKPFYDPALLALGGLVVVAFSALLRFAYRRDRAACLLIASGAMFLGPLLNFSYTGIYVTTSDHFLYLPILAWSAGLLRLFRDRVASLFEVRVYRIAFGGVLLLYTAVDAVRTLDYRDNSVFWNHELEVNPDNPVALMQVSRLAAARGDLESAFSIVKHATAPASTRFFLLAGVPGMRVVAQARVLSLDSLLRADGDVRALEKDYEELEKLLTVCRSERGEILSPAGVLEAASRNGQIASIVSDTALLGTRIGRTARAQQLASAVTYEMIWRSANPMNLVLTNARLGEFGKARKILALIQKPPAGVAPAGSAEAHAELQGRLREAEALFVRTRNEPEDRARVDSATAYAELGAYLQALRVLRPAFDHSRDSPGVAPLYVQLLVSARLDDEALATAKDLLGSEQGPKVVEGLREQLTPRVRSLKKPEEPSPWWRG